MDRRIDHLELAIEGVADVAHVRRQRRSAGRADGRQHRDEQRGPAAERQAREQQTRPPDAEQRDGARDQQGRHREAGDQDEARQDGAEHAAERGDAVDPADAATEHGEVARHQADGRRSGHAEEHERRSEQDGRAHQRSRLQAERRGRDEHALAEPGHEQEMERGGGRLEREGGERRPAIRGPSPGQVADRQAPERHTDQRRPHVDARPVVGTHDPRPEDLDDQNDRASQERGDEHVRLDRRVRHAGSVPRRNRGGRLRAARPLHAAGLLGGRQAGKAGHAPGRRPAATAVTTDSRRRLPLRRPFPTHRRESPHASIGNSAFVDSRV